MAESVAQHGGEARSKSQLRVGLLGPYASRNLGDTAIQMAVIGNLRARRPDLEIVGICPDPDDTARSLGIGAFPLDGYGPATTHEASGRAIRTAVKADLQSSGVLTRGCAFGRINVFVRSLDLLIVSGGGQLDDFWGGAWEHPFALFAWTTLTRLRGGQVAFMGVGMDRLSNRFSRFFALSALRLASYRSFRDAGTLAALESLGLRATSHLCPDLAFSLSLEDTKGYSTTASEPFVAVNPVSAKTWAHSSEHSHDIYLQNLAAACEWVATRGLRVHVVCSQHAMDRPVAVRLAEMVHSQVADRIVLRDALRVSDYLAEVKDAQVVIASRLHGAILSLLAGVPVVAVSPLRKVTQLMEDVGLADYSVELQNFVGSELLSRIGSALDQGPNLQRKIREQTRAFYAELAQTYDDVLALIG